MNCSTRHPGFIDHFFLTSDFRQLPCQDFLQFFPFFYHCCFCIWNFHCLRHRNEFVKKTVMIHRIHPFFSDMILMRFVSSSLQPWSRTFVGINNTSVFRLAFPILHWVSPLLFIGILQGIAAGIGTSNFLWAAFIVSLTSSSSGSMKYITLNCLALSSFGFSTAHLCFALLFAASDINFHMPHIIRTRSFLVTSMYFNGASSSRAESSWSGVGECNASDFFWKISCSSPRSGRSRVKVDVLRRCSTPKILTVPSATGNVKFPLLCGVNTSFALRLLAWSSDVSISSNYSMSATTVSPFQIHPAYNA